MATHSDSNSMYQIPQGYEEVASVTPESPRVIDASQISAEYSELTRQLHEEASRYALASTPLFAETVREFAARPEMSAPVELAALTQIGRELANLRRSKLTELLHDPRRPLKYRTPDGANKIAKDFIDYEGELGAAIFGEPTEGQRWKFYYENGNGQDEWFFERRHSEANEPYSVVRYILEPRQVRKVENGERSEIVEQNELEILAFAAQRYLERAKTYLYAPASQGRHRG